MELLTKLQEDMKVALKSGQKERLLVIRMLISDVKNVDLMPGKPTPEQAVEAYAKKLRKSLEEYVKLNQADQIGKLKFEIGVVDEYLPKKLSEEQTIPLVDGFLAAATYTEKQTGQAIGAFMKANGGTVDAGIASKLIKARLAGK